MVQNGLPREQPPSAVCPLDMPLPGPTDFLLKFGYDRFLTVAKPTAEPFERGKRRRPPRPSCRGRRRKALEAERVPPWRTARYPFGIDSAAAGLRSAARSFKEIRVPHPLRKCFRHSRSHHAAYSRRLEPLQSLAQLLQPGRVGNLVIINEGDHVTARIADRCVAGIRDILHRLDPIAQRDAATLGVRTNGVARCAAGPHSVIVDDHDFEVPSSILAD